MYMIPLFLRQQIITYYNYNNEDKNYKKYIIDKVRIVKSMLQNQENNGLRAEYNYDLWINENLLFEITSKDFFIDGVFDNMTDFITEVDRDTLRKTHNLISVVSASPKMSGQQIEFIRISGK